MLLLLLALSPSPSTSTVDGLLASDGLSDSTLAGGLALTKSKLSLALLVAPYSLDEVLERVTGGSATHGPMSRAATG